MARPLSSLMKYETPGGLTDWGGESGPLKLKIVKNYKISQNMYCAFKVCLRNMIYRGGQKNYGNNLLNPFLRIFILFFCLFTQSTAITNHRYWSRIYK